MIWNALIASSTDNRAAPLPNDPDRKASRGHCRPRSNTPFLGCGHYAPRRHIRDAQMPIRGHCRHRRHGAACFKGGMRQQMRRIFRAAIRLDRRPDYRAPAHAPFSRKPSADSTRQKWLRPNSAKRTRDHKGRRANTKWTEAAMHPAGARRPICCHSFFPPPPPPVVGSHRFEMMRA